MALHALPRASERDVVPSPPPLACPRCGGPLERWRSGERGQIYRCPPPAEGGRSCGAAYPEPLGRWFYRFRFRKAGAKSLRTVLLRADDTQDARVLLERRYGDVVVQEMEWVNHATEQSSALVEGDVR